MTDPFLIAGPAVISFSGGRTSGYMLWRILQAHAGALPDDVVVCFANTGREMPATLDFVRDCAAVWNVQVHWLEFVARRADGYREVSHNSAARDGEPFAAMLHTKASLPNALQRGCTSELKIRTMKRFARQHFGSKARPVEVIGLRADEKRRVEKSRDEARQVKMGHARRVLCPLFDAGVRLEDVQAFWRDQPFDLMLKGKWEGNCDLCFLKSKSAIMRVMRDYPQRGRWWIGEEAIPRGRPGRRHRKFRLERETYADLAKLVAANPMLPMMDETMVEGGEACDGYCGV